MGATVPDGIAYLVSGSPINPVSESSQQASTVQAAFLNRALYSYSWPNAAGRTGQTGMAEGATGYQRDNEQPYWYLGSTYGWVPIRVGHPAYGGGRVISASTDITPTGTSGNYRGQSVITFPVGFFNSTPQIQVSVFSANPLNIATSYTAATAAGFTACLGRTDGAYTTTVSWQASE